MAVRAPHRDIEADVSRWAVEHYGPSARVDRLQRMPGHSGISYLIVVHSDGGEEDLVLRVPPLGVRRQANLDVVRFAPVLKLAGEGGVPVPRVRWVSDDERWFGTPYLMVSRIEGAPLPDIFEVGRAYPGADRVAAIFEQGMEALAAIHALDPASLLTERWAVPATREQDIGQWRPLLHKSADPEQIRRTEELGDRLLAAAPPDVAPRVVHGDFYSNNWMLEADRLTGVLDWENATLNDPGWDLGWLATLYDPQCWGPSRAPGMTWQPGVTELYTWYEGSSRMPLLNTNWYQALMCYRLASITPAKVRLHRTGRRIDPVWEVFDEAIPYQLDRAFGLLQGPSDDPHVRGGQ